VIVTLPRNGLRLQFDGEDQRLRFIEILDFTKSSLVYKSQEIRRGQSEQDDVSTGHEHRTSARFSGPNFRQVYHKTFGPTFPGEYHPPSKTAGEYGTYVLSYPGVAFSFPFKHSAWSGSADFVALMSSDAAFPAKHLAIFDGNSWPEVRDEIFERPPPHPRSLNYDQKARDPCFDEIELIKIRGDGFLDMVRRASPTFHLRLNETTTADLVAELGPPDAIFRKYDRRLSIHRTRTASHSENPEPLQRSQPRFGRSTEAVHASDGAIEDSDSDEDGRGPSNECFYNYFSHGFDIFVSRPFTVSPGLIPPLPKEDEEPVATETLVATKILLHGNVPGSHDFNRWRRSRWVLEHDQFRTSSGPINSEAAFSEVKPIMERNWHNTYATMEEEKAQQQPMVLNRGWGQSPSSSIELLGDMEDSFSMPQKESVPGHAVHVMANTELHGFPGLLFEVLKNDAISCLTIY
jgi:hypothetical protein